MEAYAGVWRGISKRLQDVQKRNSRDIYRSRALAGYMYSDGRPLVALWRAGCGDSGRGGKGCAWARGVITRGIECSQ